MDITLIHTAPIKITSAARSHQGLLRESNEDFYLVMNDLNLFILADGLGGKNGGDIASKEVIYSLERQAKQELSFLNKDAERTQILESLKRMIKEANRSIIALSSKNPQLEGMGSTLTLAYFHERLCYFANIGDSRLYRLRENNLVQLTQDDTLLSELLHFGFIGKEEAQTFPLKHVISKSIGSAANIDPSCMGVDKIKLDDTYLLCSDGLWNLVNEQTIKQTLNSSSSLEEISQNLVDQALIAGGADNITVIVIKIIADSRDLIA